MARIAEPTPDQCSVCWQTRRDLRHVDFDQGTEGPVLRDEQNHLVQIDQIVICEVCLAAGAKLVGLVDWAERQDEFDALQARAETAEAKLAEQLEHTNDLRKALSSKPDRGRSSGTRAGELEPAVA